MLLLAGLGSASAQDVGEFDLLIHDTRRGETISITDTPGFGEFNAGFSPNGKTVLYEVIEETFSIPPYLALTDIETGISVPLPGGEGGNDAAFSPNGQYIAFDRANVDDPSIYLMPAVGGTPTLLRPLALAPAWSNNSRRLAFLDITDGSIRTIDVRTGEETNLGEAGVFGDFPDWSPNGKWISYQTFGGDLRAIRVNKRGEPLGEPILVTFDTSFDASPSWSNNSKTIVFNSDREAGEVDLWTVNIGEVQAPPECGVEDSGNDPAEAYGVPVFLRGSMNDWAANDKSMFVNQGNDIYEVEILLPDGFSFFKVASADWVAADFAPPNPVDLGVPQVMVPAPGGIPTGVIEVAGSGCYSFAMDASNTAAPILVVTEVSTGFIGAPATRLTGAPGTADVDPAYSNNGRFVVYSGVIAPQP
jgi:Tol biopolymer transport system component